MPIGNSPDIPGGQIPVGVNSPTATVTTTAAPLGTNQPAMPIGYITSITVYKTDPTP